MVVETSQPSGEEMQRLERESVPGFGSELAGGKALESVVPLKVKAREVDPFLRGVRKTCEIGQG